MAASPMPQPEAAPQPQGAAPASPQTGSASALRVFAAMTRLAQMAAQSFPATAPMMEEITRQVQQAAQKVISSQPEQPSPSTPF